LPQAGATADSENRLCSRGVSHTRIRPCVFHRLKDVGTIESPDETSVAFNHGKRPLRGLQKDVYTLVEVCLGLKG
jgi:hypothetical protein